MTILYRLARILAQSLLWAKAKGQSPPTKTDSPPSELPIIVVTGPVTIQSGRPPRFRRAPIESSMTAAAGSLSDYGLAIYLLRTIRVSTYPGHYSTRTVTSAGFGGSISFPPWALVFFPSRLWDAGSLAGTILVRAPQSWARLALR